MSRSNQHNKAMGHPAARLIVAAMLMQQVRGQPTTSYTSLETEAMTGSMTAALRYTLLMPLKKIHDALEPLERMRDDLASMAASSSQDAAQRQQQSPPYRHARGPFLPGDCGELYKEGYVRSGVYNVYIHAAGQPVAVPVFCDMETDGGGWLVIQRRQDGSVNFYQNWKTYAKGFGNVTREFWLGNDLIHLFSDHGAQVLRVDLRDHEDQESFAMYHDFYVGPRKTKYVLNIDQYSGTAGDSLSSHNNAKFSTKDQDNDLGDGRSCAVMYKGAWWYKSCHTSNLNGIYEQTGSHNMTSFADHVTWLDWRGYRYSIKFTEMKMRPKTF